MKDFKSKLKAILEQLKLTDKAKANQLTDDDWDQIAQAYKDKYESDFYEDQTKAENEAAQEAARARRASVHQSVLSLLETAEADEQADADTGSGVNSEQLTQLQNQNAELQRQNSTLNDQVRQLGQQAELDNPTTETVVIGLMGPGTTQNHLFGIENDMFSMSHRWNQIAANPGFAKLHEVDEHEDGGKFRKAVVLFGSNLASRYRELHESGKLAELTVKGAALDVEYSDLADAGLGKQFVVRRMDALLARLQDIPTVHHLFPRRFGVQDREVMTNAFFSEFSQAYQVGEIYKGGVDLQPEMGHVDDAMFKALFNSMKWIERQYIGYLNTEGSDPVKWSMVEWMLLKIASVLITEQAVRNIRGHFVKPTTGTAGNYLFAGFGVIHTLIRKVHELKLLPNSDASFNTYDNTLSTMVDAVDYFIEEVLETKDNLQGYAIYLNKAHRSWYIKGLRYKYGKDTDFGGPNGEMVFDRDIPIKWVPNMGQSKLMILQKPGNIQLIENVPGEMLKIKIERKMETVQSWSVWKEGAAPSFCGKKFDSLAELVANNYALQEVFINKPATTLGADDTTPDVASNFWLLTPANSGATAITDLDNAKDGEVYIIEIGNATNPSNIAKAGKFDELTAAWTPTAVGDYIKLYYDATNSKFHDLERCVGGTRTIVAAEQPNIEGAAR